MLTLLFSILLGSFIFRMIWLAIRMTWGLSRILLRIVFLPITLIILVVAGFLRMGIFLLLIFGLISLFSTTTRAC